MSMQMEFVFIKGIDGANTPLFESPKVVRANLNRYSVPVAQTDKFGANSPGESEHCSPLINAPRF